VGAASFLRGKELAFGIMVVLELIVFNSRNLFPQIVDLVMLLLLAGASFLVLEALIELDTLH